MLFWAQASTSNNRSSGTRYTALAAHCDSPAPPDCARFQDRESGKETWKEYDVAVEGQPVLSASTFRCAPAVFTAYDAQAAQLPTDRRRTTAVLQRAKLPVRCRGLWPGMDSRWGAWCKSGSRPCPT
jgi:hypothetical protein